MDASTDAHQQHASSTTARYYARDVGTTVSMCISTLSMCA
jgi:hypothetical protein